MARLKLSGVAGTDTESVFVLSIDGVVINHASITRARIALVGGGSVLDSQAYAAAWIFGAAGNLQVRLGRGELAAGQRYRGRLITYDVAHPNGLAWDADIEIGML